MEPNLLSALDAIATRAHEQMDLADYSARDILIAGGAFIHPHAEALAEDDDGGAYPQTGRPASTTVRRGEDPASEAVREIRGGVAQRADAP